MNGPAWDQGILFWAGSFGSLAWIAVGIYILERVHVWEVNRRKDWRCMGVPIRRKGRR